MIGICAKPRRGENDAGIDRVNQKARKALACEGMGTAICAIHLLPALAAVPRYQNADACIATDVGRIIWRAGSDVNRGWVGSPVQRECSDGKALALIAQENEARSRSESVCGPP